MKHMFVLQCLSYGTFWRGEWGETHAVEPFLFEDNSVAF